MRARQLRGLFVRLFGALSSARSDREFREELESHLQMHVDDGVRAGLPPEEARRRALLKLGGVARTAERYREQRGLPALEMLAQDARHGLRRLAANPVFTAVALLSLALGIGANAAIFSMVNSLFFRPLPVERPDELVSLQNTAKAGSRSFLAFSYPNYRDLRDRNRVLAGLIGYRFAPLSVSRDGASAKMWGYVVSGNYFEVLGVRPRVGRLISPEDDTLAGAHPVTVVSHRYWRQSLGADPGVVGTTLLVNGRSFTIIGIAPEGFFGTQLGIAPDFWFPMAMQAEIEMGSAWLDARDVEIVMLQGRLAPGVGLAAAETALNDIALQLEREHPEVNAGKRIALAQPGLWGRLRSSALGFSAVLMAVVAFALLLACTNLANLLLARSSERRAEIALRLSLGASRGRLVRQLMTESMLLAVTGGLLGVVLAAWLLRLSAQVELPIDFPFLLELHLDYRVLGFTAAVALLTGVAFGLLPALQATKTSLFSTVKAHSAVTGAPRTWLRGGLIVFQVALSLVLLAGGGLMLRALQRAETLAIGFDPRNAVELAFDLRLAGYDSAGGRELRRRALERVRSLPGVRAAGTIDLAPIDLHFGRAPVFVEGRPEERLADAPRAMTSRISPGYLEAMGARLLRGRDFDERDDENAPRVAIVNEAFARGFWPGQDPIGKRLREGSPLSPLMEVIGVVEDGKYASLSESPQPYVCRPVDQAYAGATSLIVRTASDPRRTLQALRQQVQRLDPGMPLSSRLLTDRMALPLLPARLAAAVLGGFGLLALALAAIGIYGVMSCAVAARTREIGVRIALGASAGDVLRHTLRRGMALALLGVVIGAAAALGLARLMASLLFGVSPSDPSIYLAVAALLLAAALLACYVPARRATRVDPVTALRCE